MIELFPEGTDPTFATYTICTVVGLLAAGFVLVLLGGILRKNVSGAWLTYKGWLFILPCVFGAIYMGRVWVIVGTTVLSVFAFKEFARGTGLYRDWWYTCAVYIGIASLCAVTLATDPNTGATGWYGMFTTVPVFTIALLVTIPILRNRSEGQLQRVCLSVVGFIYVGWLFGHLGYLANSEHYIGYVLYLVFAVQLNDIAAFTFGKALGKRKLRSEVSPNKTVEGSLGAALVSLALPWAMHFSFPHFETVELLLTGLIVGIGGQLGDLAISFIKRDLGVKDMGTLIPGHGGLLDRLDSLIFTAPLFFHMVRWFHGV